MDKSWPKSQVNHTIFTKFQQLNHPIFKQSIKTNMLNQLYATYSSCSWHVWIKNGGDEVGRNLPSGEDPMPLELV